MIQRPDRGRTRAQRRGVTAAVVGGGLLALMMQGPVGAEEIQPVAPVLGSETPATQLPAPQLPAPEMPATQLPATPLPAPQLPAPEMPATPLPAPQLPAPEMPATGPSIPTLPVDPASGAATPATGTPEVPIVQLNGFELALSDLLGPTKATPAPGT